MLADVIDPLAGWGGLLLQGGAFVLLAYVVTVMAPKIMKESKEERLSRDKTFSDLTEALQVKFEERNKALATAVREQTIALVTEMKRETDILDMALRTVCKADDRGAT